MYVVMGSLDVVYSQASGCCWLADSEDARTLLARGYSGHGSDRNRPEAEARGSRGPIPRGVWRVETARHHPRLGPCTFPLVPVSHDAHGRDGFFIHGDNAEGNGTASTGCVILPRPAREAIRALGVRCLYVIE